MLKAINFWKYCFIVTGLTVNLLPLKALAFSDTSLNSLIQACAKLTNDMERLSCFDELVTPDAQVNIVKVKKEENTKNSTIDKAQTQPQKVKLTAEQEDKFAKEYMRKTSEEKLEAINSIELTISKVKKLIRGELKITFENGQVWQQKDGVRFKLKVGDKVILEKGASSAIYLKKAGTNKRIRVKRLK